MSEFVMESDSILRVRVHCEVWNMKYRNITFCVELYIVLFVNTIVSQENIYENNKLILSDYE